MANEPDEGLVRLAGHLHSAAIHLLRGVRRVDALSGLPGAQLSALSVVVFGGPLSLGALAAAERVRPPTMGRVGGALERAGLVTREPDPADARAVVVAATRAGGRLLAEGPGRRGGGPAARLRGPDGGGRP